MNTSCVRNWNSLGRRTAWLRLFMKTFALRAPDWSFDCGIYMSICHAKAEGKRESYGAKKGFDLPCGADIPLRLRSGQALSAAFGQPALAAAGRNTSDFPQP